MPAPLSYRFPPKFIWGAATAATQIEGAADADGRGPSVWDTFSRRAGAVAHGDTPADACDHFHRYEEDFALLQRLGLRHYRLSIGWPRLFPTGTGRVNPAGLAFYDRLIDALLARGITPWVTLYHWDLPQTLEDAGGWRERATVTAFAHYADTVVRALGDRVKRWITMNEIPCFIGMGYGTGEHAPGARENRRVLAQAYHHALLAHGEAVRAVRAFGGRGAQVGLTQNPAIGIPVTELPPDIAAAQAWTELHNEHLLNPVFCGRYPTRYLRSLGADRPQIARGDLALISQPTDFLGLNVYTGNFIRAAARGKPEVLPLPPQYPLAGLPWLHLAPPAIYWAMRHLHTLYAPRAFHITENGVGYEEAPDAQGEVLDLHRCEYLRGYLHAVHRAAAEGIPVRGYFVWSLLDNFEWAYGYAKRFGIVHVDYATQRRTPKLSAKWYASVARENRVL
ncbi:GH1 family beta-glucosidase [Opitutus sp. ER46]|uniref:GH1 family beta-glucosidase n=1 Tax=Opitutus sp. ER46 TaxID=2161864 RepID=UPI000D3050F3|nr:GH1 family beta-glucosidase [Opitutus sp. ER46]PTY00143.1 beta-glucosidase [Opitutus sp. ER46]